MQTFVLGRVHRLARLATLAAIAAGFAACSSDSPTDAVAHNDAALRVINGATGAVRVVVDGTVRVASLAPATVSTSIDVPAGARTVRLEPIDGSLSGTSTAEITASASGTRFVAARSVSGALAAQVVSDTGAVPAPGTSKLRVIHLAANAAPVQVWRKQPDFPDVVQIMFPFPYGAESNYIQSAPGQWIVYVTPDLSGVNPSTSANATLTLTIDADVARTVVMLDKPGGGIQLSVLTGN